MRASRFPDPRSAGPDGIVAVGGELSPAMLIDAYSHGIFPWPQEGLPLLWFSPQERGLVDLSLENSVPTRFARKLSKWREEGRVEIRLDTEFREVVRSCQEASRKNQSGTWILPEMVTAYTEMHRLGHAHSFEVFLDGELAGGLYGVFVRGVFSGESMFHRQTDAGKVALEACIRFLREKGLLFLDVQMVTPVVQAFGGHLVNRDTYLKKLELAQNRWDRGLCRFEWVKGQLSH